MTFWKNVLSNTTQTFTKFVFYDQINKNISQKNISPKIFHKKIFHPKNISQKIFHKNISILDIFKEDTAVFAKVFFFNTNFVMEKTFIINLLSCTISLIPMQRFRAITFFNYKAIFFKGLSVKKTTLS